MVLGYASFMGSLASGADNYHRHITDIGVLDLVGKVVSLVSRADFLLNAIPLNQHETRLTCMHAFQTPIYT